MAVGRVGGGSKGRTGGVSGGGATQGASKAQGSGFARVERTEAQPGVSGLVGSANAGPTDPVTAQAQLVARQLKSGQIRTREEATKKLVGDILKQKLRMKSEGLTQKIADALQQDPRLQAALERLWDGAEGPASGASSSPQTPASGTASSRASGWTVKGE